MSCRGGVSHRAKLRDRRGSTSASPGKKVIIAPRIDFHTEAQMNDGQMEAARRGGRPLYAIPRAYRDIEQQCVVLHT